MCPRLDKYHRLPDDKDNDWTARDRMYSTREGMGQGKSDGSIRHAPGSNHRGKYRGG